jgi:hypothetical protein
MECISTGEDLEFYKDFIDVAEGTYQYKFRLGTGGWWVLDEEAPTGVYSFEVQKRVVLTV